MKYNKKKYELVKQIIDKETRRGPKSIRQLSEASANYTENGKRISRDTIKKYLLYLKDVNFQPIRGRKGSKIISKKNNEVYMRFVRAFSNLLIRMKHEDPELALDNYCYAFIGDVPCAFTKSVEAMQSHLATETSLRQRHLRDLSKVQEKYIREYMNADKIGRVSIEAKIEDEVGWTVGDYLKKLLKKVEKEEGIRKIMVFYGITDEMLEEMNKERVMHAKQERLFRTFLSAEKEKL